MTCAHHCALEKSKCKSFNFIADPTFTGNCELNFGKAQKLDDANLVPRNGMKYFEEINQDAEDEILATKEPSNTPEIAANSPALKFRGNNIVEYGISNKSQLFEDLTSISACFWMNAENSSISGQEPAILSYAVPWSDNEFLIVLDPELTVYFEKGKVSTGLDLIDGRNHHVCVTWTFADHNFTTYLDGSHAKTFPAARKSKQSIQAGNLTEVHVWNRVLTASEIKDIASSCVPTMKGNLKAYTDFEIKGEVETYIPKCGLE
ncbi:Hypothetical predicted protein [Paramuricea clavata]|uniref:Uncharacterized protein n=1 Tax=Paramuricea clavata TaxID=317549 RepID=A0A7D9EUI8_PARCT|nr:Hypothetical predicted protein [Paramuricea clavata]